MQRFKPSYGGKDNLFFCYTTAFQAWHHNKYNRLMSKYFVRKITSGDDPAILAIARRCFEEFGAPLTGSVYCDPKMEHLSEEFQRDDAEYWVVEDALHEVLGGCGFFPTQGLPEGMAEVVKLYFSPKLRVQGMGHKMLRHIEQRARQTGYRRLYIESFPEFSKAVSLYEKFGFQHIDHALGNSGHSAVTIWMTKDISHKSSAQL